MLTRLRTCLNTSKYFITGVVATPRSAKCRRPSSCKTGSRLSRRRIWRHNVRPLEHEKQGEAQLKGFDQQVCEIESEIVAWHRTNDVSRKLAKMPGIGPITASAMVASIGDAKSFKNGRQVSAWLELV